jgi:glucose/arabinose dehydrogenase
MRRAVAMGLLCVACLAEREAEERAPFVPIGHIDVDAHGPEPPVDGADAAADAPPDAASPSADALPVVLAFDPMDHDADALRWTDLAFLPEPLGELIAVDKDGFVFHLRLEGNTMRTLGRFQLSETHDHSDAGLLSVAIDPSFADNHFFYLGLSTGQTRNIIQRHRLDPTDYAATRDSATLVMEVSAPRARRSWHNIGSIGFTEDGYMWALFGDKVVEYEAQNPHSPLGALVRIIPDHDEDGGYTVPADNPFADGRGHPAVYAVGLRSPWKGTYYEGRWWFGDVGFDTYEEVNLVDAPGQNFGWPDIEGPCPADGCGESVAPWVYYGRGSGDPFVRADPEATPARHRSVWVGAVYRRAGGDRYDGRMDDILVFGDAFSGFVRARRLDGGAPSFHVGHLWGATAMAEGPDGYLYVTALGTWPVDAPTHIAPIYRVVLGD